MMQPVAGIRGVQGFRLVELDPGIEPINAVGAVGYARLPTDPIGSFTLTLTNVVVGSAVQVEVFSTGAVLSNSTAAATDVTLVLPAYAAGSPLNDLRIKVRKGSSAPFYRPFETLAVAEVGDASIYVAQIEDD